MRSAQHAWLAACLVSGPATAGWVLDSGLTTIGMASSDHRELSASADLVLSDGSDAGWLLYLEASTAPRDGGVASAFPQANADIGTAVDADGNARVQVSELRWRTALRPDTWLHAGLLDTAGFVDRSHITNDETRQFLGASFVNNPTINFPDYTLGVALDRPLGDADGQGYSVVIAGSDGLADDPAHSYGQLLRSDDGEGVFVAAAWRRRAGPWTGRGGAWINTREVERLDRPGRTGRDGRGLFLSIGRALAVADLNLRLGLADPRFAEADRFASLAARAPLGRGRLGIAASVAWPSSRLGPDRAEAHQVEVFWRISLPGDAVAISPSLQYIDNADNRRGPSGWIAGLRLQFDASHRIRRVD